MINIHKNGVEAMKRFLKLFSFLISLTLIASCTGMSDFITGKDQQEVPSPRIINSANPPEGNSGAASATKSRVLFTQFDAINTIQLDDINNPYDGLPQLIATQLEADDAFSVRYVNGFLPREYNSFKQDLIIKLAREAEAQFLVSGMILDAGIMEQPGYLGTPIGRSSRRYFVIEFSVYDGLTGTQLKTFRVEHNAHGDVGIGRDKPIGSNRFGLTESGRALNELMDRAATNIASIIKSVTLSVQKASSSP